jgi:hypothetical protein
VTGVLRCPSHHPMLRVARALWLCQKCEYVTGDMKHLKGAVDDARALVAKAGGFETLVKSRREQMRSKRELRKALKAKEKEALDEHGHYQPWTIEDWRMAARNDASGPGSVAGQD